MLDIREVEYWISRYENEANKLDHCVTLSALYTIRDKMQGTEKPEPDYGGYSKASAPHADIQSLGQYGNSEFLQSIAGKDASAVFGVIDGLMENLQVVNPRVYNNVLRKIGEI